MFLDIQEALTVNATISKDDTAIGSNNPDRYVLFRHGLWLESWTASAIQEVLT